MGSVFRDKLTVFMATSDTREKYFRRSLAFLRQQGFDGTLMVLDWGKTPLSDSNLWCDAEPFQVDYKHYGPDCPYFDRMLDGASRIATPYVVFYPDDDFMFFDVLNECVKILEGRQDVSAAVGKAVRVNENATNKFEIYQQLSFEQDVPLARIGAIFSSYNHVIYSVVRRELLVERMRLGARFHDDGAFWQYFDSTVVLAHGKVISVPRLGFVRTVNPLGLGYNQARYRDPASFPFLLLADDFSRKFAFFREMVRAVLCDIGQVVDAKTDKQLEVMHLALMRWVSCFSRQCRSDNKLVPELLADSKSERDKLALVGAFIAHHMDG